MAKHKPRKRPAPRRAPVAPPATVRRTASGRWQYVHNGRFAPEVNGKPIPASHKKDKNGIPYNVEARRQRAIANFGPTRKSGGKKPAQSANLGIRAGIALWKGPPKPDWPTVYATISEIARIKADTEAKRSGLTSWCNDHAVPATKRPKGERKSHRMMNHWAVTVSRHAEAWATLTLSWFPKIKEWHVDSSSPISDEPIEAASMGEEKREKPPSDLDKLEREVKDESADRLSVHVPIRRARS
jgi:hypothetical protein